jgi:hypothetical protein
MAGTVIDRQLTARSSGRVQFRLATRDDDPAIRRLLRENPMRGRITVSFEREPDYFQGLSIGGAEDRTILAFERGQLVCMGRVSVRHRFLNGTPRRVGYLSDLRLDASAAGRFDVLRRGYQFFRKLDADDPPDFYFTSIAADNARSLRFLERGLPGMPAYEHLTDFVTLLIPVPRRAGTLRALSNSARRRFESGDARCSAATNENAEAIVACLNAHARRHQLACAWSINDLLSLERHGLALEDFQIVWSGGKVIGCAALWDQRDFRQTVVRGYGSAFAWGRPWIEIAAWLAGTPGLPRVGSALAHASLSPFALESDRSEWLLALIESILPLAATRGLDFITLGFAAGDPRLSAIKNRFRHREYLSRLYRVDWPRETTFTADQRGFFPEVALL